MEPHYLPKLPATPTTPPLDISLMRGSDLLINDAKPHPALDAPPLGPPKLDELAQKSEGTLLGKIAKGILRGAAGAVGGTLYGATLISSVTFTAAVVIPTCLIIQIPLIILGYAGAGIGAAAGAARERPPGEDRKYDIATGAIAGAWIGGALPLGAATLVEYGADIPKLVINKTIGTLGAGLIAFSQGKDKSEKTEEKLQSILGRTTDQRLFIKTYKKLTDQLKPR